MNAKMYYSKKTNGFYPYSFKADYGANWPDDAVPLVDGDHERIMDLLSQGYYLTGDENGYPIAVAPPENNWSDLIDGKWVENLELKATIIRAQNEAKRDELLKQARDALIVISTDIMMGEQDGEDDTAQKKVRTQLKEIMSFLSKVDLSEEFIEWPEVPKF